jgi:hypothetical protein
MIKLRIEGVSPDGSVKTDNIYTYYYCPDMTKRVNVNVNHEITKSAEIGGSKLLRGSYSSLLTYKGRSATIADINTGNILPQLHLFTEDETIQNYPIPLDPVSKLEEIILSTTDDIDLGSKAWFCIDDPSTGKAHALIFPSNTGFISGEEDGLQVGSFVEQPVKLPGLEVDVGNVFAAWNCYEKGKEENLIIPKGLNITFDVEFITFEKEGYEAVDQESELYQILVASRPKHLQKGFDGEDIGHYVLKTYVHLAPSFPLGNLMSLALGKNFSYISAELYKDDGSFISSGSLSRMSLSEEINLDIEDASIFQKIGRILGLFEWRNISFFKKICFPDVEPGRYVVKIYRENPIFAMNHQYIGFAVVELNGDSSIHISCRPEAIIQLSVMNQNEKGIGNVKFLLEKDDAVIADVVSDINGSATLKAPCYPTKPYTLKVIYQGFLVEERNIRLGLKNRFIPLSESFSFDQYKFTLKLKDTWDSPPAVDVNPILTSNEMVDPIRISAEKKDNGKYVFTEVYPAEYVLELGYKSYDLEKQVEIERDQTLDIVFPAEYQIDFDVMNSYSNLLSDGEIWLSRNGVREKGIIKDGKALFFVPPGEYEITVYMDDDKIAHQRIDVRGDKKVDIVTSAGSFFHNVVLYLGILLGIFSIAFMFWKRKICVGLKLLAISFIVIALVSPWWVVNGDDGVTSTTTNTILIPSNIVTLTSSSQTIGGEISTVPGEITMAFGVLAILLIISCLLIGLSILAKNKFRKIAIVLSVLSVLILIVTISIFVYAMLQLTEVGVGGFIGDGELEITLPGIAENKMLHCSWGPGIGFYLSVIAVLVLLVDFFKIKFYFWTRR